MNLLENKHTGFLQDAEGNWSNSRLIADIMIICGLLMTASFIVIGVWAPLIDLMKIATAIGVLFGSIAGTAMTFLFFQKKTEAGTEKANIEAKE